jgi:hypothetical protein
MSLPTATFANPSYEYYLRNQGVINISSLNVSTIVADTLGVLPDGSGLPSFIVAGQAGNILIETDVLRGSTLVHKDKVFNTNESTLQTFNQGFAAGASNYIMEYVMTDLNGTTHTKGSIDFVSSIGAGASGGLVMTAEDGLQFSIGNSTVGAYQAGAAVVTSIASPDAKISHFVGSTELSKLEFTKNASTISLVSGAGAFVEVGAKYQPSNQLSYTFDSYSSRRIPNGGGFSSTGTALQENTIKYGQLNIQLNVGVRF